MKVTFLAIIMGLGLISMYTFSVNACPTGLCSIESTQEFDIEESEE